MRRKARWERLNQKMGETANTWRDFTITAEKHETAHGSDVL
jgi:hypothetical protein